MTMTADEKNIVSQLANAYAEWHYWHFHAVLGERRSRHLARWARALELLQETIGITLVYPDQLTRDYRADTAA